jgi:hypothetical protein
MAENTSISFLVDLFVVLAFNLLKAREFVNYSIWLVICNSIFSLDTTVVAAPFLFNAVKQFLIDLEPHYFLIYPGLEQCMQ